MGEAIFVWLKELEFLSLEMAVFFTAWLPVAELRAAIPLGIFMGVPPLQAFLLGVIGNMMPVVPLILFLNPVRNFLKRKSKLMARFFDYLDLRTINKSDHVQRYGALGLILFTAIPLPTTGAWTASLAAVLFKIKFSYAVLSITVGVILAGILITGASIYLLQ